MEEIDDCQHAQGLLEATRLYGRDGIFISISYRLHRWVQYGWAERCREAIVLQIRIDSRNYAVMAAMSEDGFIGWEIYEHNVRNTDVVNFIKVRVAPLFGETKFLLLDNAANQCNSVHGFAPRRTIQVQFILQSGIKSD